VVHNGLRFLASAAGAPWGIFNYLHPFHPKLDRPALIEIATALLVTGIALIIAWKQWDRPSDPIAESRSVLSILFWTMPTAALGSQRLDGGIRAIEQNDAIGIREPLRRIRIVQVGILQFQLPDYLRAREGPANRRIQFRS